MTNENKKTILTIEEVEELIKSVEDATYWRGLLSECDEYIGGMKGRLMFYFMFESGARFWVHEDYTKYEAEPGNVYYWAGLEELEDGFEFPINDVFEILTGEDDTEDWREYCEGLIYDLERAEDDEIFENYANNIFQRQYESELSRAGYVYLGNVEEMLNDAKNYVTEAVACWNNDLYSLTKFFNYLETVKLSDELKLALLVD